MSKRRMMKGIVVGAVVVAAVLAAGAIYFVTFSPDRSRYPVRGIDVSHHQGEIDWAKVAADDVDFAIIKATEGGDFVDEDFAANLAGARSAGLAAGAYHFFTLCRPGAEQATNFLATVPREGLLLPPVIDLEFQGNCSARPGREAVAAELEAFLEPVETAFGREAVYYITYAFHDAYIASLPKRQLWVRWIAWHPGNENWLYWQYHDRGRVKGIGTDVDLNVLNGDGGTLADLLASSPS